MVRFYGMSTTVGYLIPNPFSYIKTVPFLTIQFSLSTSFCLYTVKYETVLFQAIPFSVSTQFQSQKTDPFQTIQFSISTQFSSI